MPRSVNPETLIQREILDWFKMAGIYAHRMSLPPVLRGKGVRAKNPLAGFPDIWGVVPQTAGQLFVVEVKTEEGSLKPHQLVWLEDLYRRGVVTVVARSLRDVTTAFTMRPRPSRYGW